MNIDRWSRVQELFHEALQLDESDRHSFLESSCGEDRAMCLEVMALLDADHVSDALLEGAEAGTFAALLLEADEEPEGRSIGRYRIIRRLGAGGMGAVYEAEQEHPRRTVALKVMRTGISTPGAVRRFEFESEMLGRLRHRGIAQIYEAGIHEDGSARVPFFAMEYIEGAQTLHEYCVDHALDTRERLQLFADICDAIHHGHQNGVIHRDIKPANILVGRNGEPRVIDFGVARATDSDVAITIVHTNVGELVGTLQYMSPEQCDGDPSRIDIRCDVYSLGMVMFELLSGQMPYDVTGASIVEAARIIRDQPPRKLSSIRRVLRGDLETIAAKALSKDREGRYVSASALAADVRRFLNDEPIVARPASAIYQMRKFARRHKPLVGGTAAVVLVMLGGIATTSWQAYAKGRQAERAAFAETEAETRRAEADLARQTAERVSNYLRGMLASVDPAAIQGEEISRRELLVEAVHRLETELIDEPAVEAAVRNTIGRVYQSLGDYEDAAHHLHRAMMLYESVHGPLDESNHEDVATSMIGLGGALVDLGRDDEAEELFDRALAALESSLGRAHPSTIQAYLWVASSHHRAERFGEAEAIFADAIDLADQHLGADHQFSLIGQEGLGHSLMAQARYAEAVSIFAQVLDTRQSIHGEDGPFVARSHRNLAWSHQMLGEFAPAEVHYRTALRIRRDIYGESHPATGDCKSSLAWCLSMLGRNEEAEPHAAAGYEIALASFGEQHRRTAAAESTLATVQAGLGQYADAEAHYRSAIGTQRALLGERSTALAQNRNWLSNVLIRQAKYAEAEHQTRLALDVLREAMGETDFHTRISLNNLAVILAYNGRYREAEPTFRALKEGYEQEFGEDHVWTARSKINLSLCLASQAHYEEAESFARSALRIWRRTYGETHTNIQLSLVNLGVILNGQGRHDEAEEIMREALSMSRELFGEKHANVGRPLDLLGVVLREAGRHEEAEAAHREALDMRRELFGDEHTDVATTLHNLATVLLERSGRIEEAQALAREALTQRRRLLPEAHPDTAQTASLLAACLIELNRLDEAEALLLASHETLERVNGSEHRRTRLAIERLINLYERSGRADEADVWRERRP